MTLNKYTIYEDLLDVKSLPCSRILTHDSWLMIEEDYFWDIVILISNQGIYRTKFAS